MSRALIRAAENNCSRSASVCSISIMAPAILCVPQYPAPATTNIGMKSSPKLPAIFCPSVNFMDFPDNKSVRAVPGLHAWPLDSYGLAFILFFLDMDFGDRTRTGDWLAAASARSAVAFRGLEFADQSLQIGGEVRQFVNGLGRFVGACGGFLGDLGDLLDVAVDFVAGTGLFRSGGGDEHNHVADLFGSFDDFVEGRARLSRRLDAEFDLFGTGFHG